MNKDTKKMLDEIDGYYLKALDSEIRQLNVKIDKRIINSKSYKELAVMHRKLITLRKQIMLGV